jgi:hypothetical protein
MHALKDDQPPKKIQTASLDTIADITALVAIDIGGRLADIKIAPELAYLTRWHELVSSRPSAKA